MIQNKKVKKMKLLKQVKIAKININQNRKMGNKKQKFNLKFKLEAKIKKFNNQMKNRKMLL